MIIDFYDISKIVKEKITNLLNYNHLNRIFLILTKEIQQQKNKSDGKHNQVDIQHI